MLTVLIPTRNRLDCLRRLLSYRKLVVGFPNVILADSSDSDIQVQVKKLVQDAEAFSSIQLMTFDSAIHLYAKVSASLQKVETRYCVLGGDDDFFVPNGLRAACSFLDENSDYSVVHGKSASIVIEGDQVFGMPMAVGPYPQNSVEEKNASARLTKHLEGFNSTWHSVQKVSELKSNFNKTALLKSHLRFGEFFPSCLSIVQGKSKCLEDLYMIRQWRPATEPYWWLRASDWLTTPEWSSYFHGFVNGVAEELIAKEKLSETEARALVKEAWISFLTPWLIEDLSRYLPKKASRFRAVGRRLRSALPGMEAYRKWSHMRKQLGSMEYDRDLDLGSLKDGKGRFSADFKPVFESLRC